MRASYNIILVLIKLVVVRAQVNIYILDSDLTCSDSLSLKIRLTYRAFILFLKKVILFVDKLKLLLGSIILLNVNYLLLGIFEKISSSDIAESKFFKSGKNASHNLYLSFELVFR